MNSATLPPLYELWITACLVEDKEWEIADYKDDVLIVSVNGDPLYLVSFGPDNALWSVIDDPTAIPESPLRDACISNVRCDLRRVADAIIKIAETTA